MAVITKEMLEEYFDTEDGKVVLEAMSLNWAKELGWKSPEEIENETKGLVKNRNQVLKELNTAKEKLKEFSDVDKKMLDSLREKSIFDPEDLEKILSGQARGEVPTDEERRAYKKALKDLETYKAEMATKDSLFQKERELRIRTQRENLITSLLNEVKVKPKALPVVMDYMDKRIKSEIGEDGNISFYSNDDLPVKQFIQEWANSEMGKDFIMPLENTGAGNHLKNGGKPLQTSKKEFGEMPPQQQRKFIEEGGQILQE